MHDTPEEPVSYIVGKAVNSCKYELGTVYVEFGLYDERGNQVGYGNNMTSHLTAGQTWIFKASKRARANVMARRSRFSCRYRRGLLLG